jgi:hypothetical protein
MKTNYVNDILDRLSIPAVVFSSLDGVCISTVYMSRVQKVLAEEQIHNQFKARKGVGNIHVSLNENSTTVCQECGSPEFTITVRTESEGIIGSNCKVHCGSIFERATVVRCKHCKEIRDTPVHKHPEVGRC